MNLVVSCDDGCASDVRLADLCTKYKIPATFYWPAEWHSYAHSKGFQPLDYEMAEAIAADHEIGAHTITHRILTDLDFDEACYEIRESKFILEALFEKKITKFCPPRGYTNKKLTDYTLLCYDSQRLTRGDGLIHVHPNSGANENLPWLTVAQHALGEIELWMHSWELDKYEEWGNLENLFKHYANLRTQS